MQNKGHREATLDPFFATNVPGITGSWYTGTPDTKQAPRPAHAAARVLIGTWCSQESHQPPNRHWKEHLDALLELKVLPGRPWACWNPDCGAWPGQRRRRLGWGQSTGAPTCERTSHAHLNTAGAREGPRTHTMSVSGQLHRCPAAVMQPQGVPQRDLRPGFGANSDASATLKWQRRCPWAGTKWHAIVRIGIARRL